MKSTLGILAAIALAAVGSLFINLEPMIVGAFVTGFHLGAQQIGAVLSLESFASIAGGAFFTFGAARIGPARLRSFAIVAYVLTNALGLRADDFTWLLVARAAAGLTEGMLLAASFALLSRAPMPSRAFAGFGIAQMLSSISGFVLLNLLIATVGRSAPFLLLAFAGVAALMLIPFFDDTPAPAQAPAARRGWLQRGALLGIGAVFVFFSAQAAIWPFLERIGTAHEVTDFAIAGGLSFGALCGFAGSVVTLALPNRLTGPPALVAAAAFNIVTILIFQLGHTAPAFLVALGAFNFAWAVYMPLQLSLLRRIDAQPQVFAFASVVTNAGFAVGPILGASFTNGVDYSLVFAIGILGTIVATAMMLLAFRRRQIPSLAAQTAA